MFILPSLFFFFFFFFFFITFERVKNTKSKGGDLYQRHLFAKFHTMKTFHNYQELSSTPQRNDIRDFIDLNQFVAALGNKNCYGNFRIFVKINGLI